jgi:predicted nucleotidyltransferase
MGGSGGGGGYYPTRQSIEGLQRLIEDARKQVSTERLDADINAYLRALLATTSQRDAAEVNQRLDAIGETLSDQVEIDRFLMGGSVAKHTFVDGLSDIDALVALKGKDAKRESPHHLLEQFENLLRSQLSMEKVAGVRTGKLAATVTYRDGLEIQLLPAIRSGRTVSIPNASGQGWNETKPMAFQRILTKQNEKLNGVLVPAIKLAKSIIAEFPEQKQMIGYHIEALAVDAAKSYDGPATPKAVLMHLFSHAADRVLRPITDVTEQSRTVDGYLGPTQSGRRKVVADALATVARRLATADSLDKWKSVVEG